MANRNSGSKGSRSCHNDQCNKGGTLADTPLVNNSFNFFHINVRSLLPKIDQIGHIVKSLNVDCLSVNETWLDKSIDDSEISLPGYLVFRSDRNRSGGGVALYIRDCLTTSVIDLSVLGFKVECVFCTLKCIIT